MAKFWDDERLTAIDEGERTVADGPSLAVLQEFGITLPDSEADRMRLVHLITGGATPMNENFDDHGQSSSPLPAEARPDAPQRNPARSRVPRGAELAAQQARTRARLEEALSFSKFDDVELTERPATPPLGGVQQSPVQDPAARTATGLGRKPATQGLFSQMRQRVAGAAAKAASGSMDVTGPKTLPTAPRRVAPMSPAGTPPTKPRGESTPRSEWRGPGSPFHGSSVSMSRVRPTSAPTVGFTSYVSNPHALVDGNDGGLPTEQLTEEEAWQYSSCHLENRSIKSVPETDKFTGAKAFENDPNALANLMSTIRTLTGLDCTDAWLGLAPGHATITRYLRARLHSDVIRAIESLMTQLRGHRASGDWSDFYLPGALSRVQPNISSLFPPSTAPFTQAADLNLQQLIFCLEHVSIQFRSDAEEVILTIKVNRKDSLANQLADAEAQIAKAQLLNKQLGQAPLSNMHVFQKFCEAFSANAELIDHLRREDRERDFHPSMPKQSFTLLPISETIAAARRFLRHASNTKAFQLVVGKSSTRSHTTLVGDVQSDRRCYVEENRGRCNREARTGRPCRYEHSKPVVPPKAGGSSDEAKTGDKARDKKSKDKSSLPLEGASGRWGSRARPKFKPFYDVHHSEYRAGCLACRRQGREDSVVYSHVAEKCPTVKEYVAEGGQFCYACCTYETCDSNRCDDFISGL
eukprot:m.307718 g.307718  ORF g.307718 m.307718 type:complete len:696 (+) comp16365_c0_seq5:256-2343(+)